MFAIAVACAILAAAAFAARRFAIERRRERLRSLPFPPQWGEIIDRHLPHASTLPRDLRWQLETHVRVFVEEKRVTGAQGVEVTVEMRVLIAAHACLLALNQGTDVFPAVRRIVVYPARPATSSTRRTVVLSWEDAAGAPRAPGRNALIREFARHLEAEARAQAPGLLDQLPLFDPVARTDPAHGLARVSEVFFEEPERMAKLHAPLYRELRRLYRVDPAHWSPDRRHALS